ncbi:CCA tRNA nucleotidyltransferase [bacterium]|jgi:tRNA nucleotidyltransferase/poly(A) polymerase|nr:CCA tRNA nucleotidyltransferase [bacterium]
MKLRNFNRHNLILEATQSFKMNLPKDILELHKLFQKNDFKLYVVGGAVRDALLKKKPKDFDVATNATPDQIEEILGGKYKIIDGGKSKEMGVTIVIINGEQYEIATFRTDIGKGRRPDSVEFTTIDKDVLRRDLTMNALFYDIDNEEIVDLVGGIDDILNNRVRAVGDANIRFIEDPLRKMRAIRFAGSTNSKVDTDIDKSLTLDNSLNGVSPERIRDEFKKSIEKAKYPANVLDMFLGYGFFDYIFPNYIINRNFETTNNWIIQLTTLLIKNEDKNIKKLIDFKYEADEVRDILFLKIFLTLSLDNFLELSNKWKISKLGKNKIDSDVLMYFGESFGMDIDSIKAFIKFKPSVNGDDVMREFGLKGRDVGQKIKEIETENFIKLLEYK